MQRSAKIYEAVLACLTVCQEAPDQPAFVTRFLERLATQPDWTPEEVEHARRLIHERLSGAEEQAGGAGEQAG